MKKYSSKVMCIVCGKIKNPKDFYRANKFSKRLRNTCIVCWASQRLLPENIKHRQKYLHSTWARFLVGRKTAKSIDREWTLTFKEYEPLAIMPCNYCKQIVPNTAVGLDRIDNSAGYILGNVLPCCGECNRLRSNVYTVDETEIMVQTIIKYRIENNIRKNILVGKYYL